MVTTTARSALRAFFPLDQELQLTPSGRSRRLTRLVTWLGAQLPYGQTQAVLAEIGGVHLSKSSCWRIMQESGACMVEALAAEEVQEKAAARAWSAPGTRPVSRERMGIALDGAMIHLIDEGWKEFKAACVFDVELETRVDRHTQDRGEFGHAVRNSYVVHLGGPTELGWKAWTEAQRRGWYAARDTLFLGDAAIWIWNQYQEHFRSSVGLVDWYHALEHLGAAKLLLYPQESAQSSRWYNQHEHLLFQGQADQVARSLLHATTETSSEPQTVALRQAAAYFSEHRDYMHYQERRDEGWPIGSGMIESGAKQFKARVAGPGMRWRRPYAERMLAVRGAVITSKERFDTLWERAYVN